MMSTYKSSMTTASWKSCRLKDFCKKRTMKNTDRKYCSVFTNSAIYGIIKQEEYFEKEVANGENIDSYYIVKPKDFIYNPRISESAPYGPIRANETGEIGIVSPLYFVFGITDPANVDYDFLKYYFASSNWHRYVYSIGNNGARSDRMNVADTDFMNMPIKLPPLLEQKRIAEILGCCDRVIALKKELIAEKKQQKKALMQKLLNPDSGFRLPGFSGKWDAFKLSDCVKIAKDKINPMTCDDSCKCVELEHIESGTGRLLGYCSTRGLKSMKTVFHKNDILFGKLRPYLKKIVLAPFSGVCCSECIVFSINIKIIPDFLYNRLFMDDFISASSTTSGTKMPRADWRYMKKFLLHIPSLKEQQAIADILSAAAKEIELLEQELAQQRQKKKALMQLLLTGIARV